MKVGLRSPSHIINAADVPQNEDINHPISMVSTPSLLPTEAFCHSPYQLTPLAEETLPMNQSTLGVASMLLMRANKPHCFHAAIGAIGATPIEESSSRCTLRMVKEVHTIRENMMLHHHGPEIYNR